MNAGLLLELNVHLFPLSALQVCQENSKPVAVCVGGQPSELHAIYQSDEL